MKKVFNCLLKSYLVMVLLFVTCTTFASNTINTPVAFVPWNFVGSLAWYGPSGNPWNYDTFVTYNGNEFQALSLINNSTIPPSTAESDANWQCCSTPKPSALSATPQTISTELNISISQDLKIGVTGGYPPYTICNVGNSNYGIYSLSGSIMTYSPSRIGQDIIPYTVMDSQGNSILDNITVNINPIPPPSPLVINDFTWSLQSNSPASSCNLIQNMKISGGNSPYKFTFSPSLESKYFSFENGVLSESNLPLGEMTYLVTVSDTSNPCQSVSAQLVVNVTPAPSGNVSINFSPSSWSNSTTVTNNSTTQVNSIQIFIPSSYFSSASSYGNISWYPSCTASSVAKGTYVLYDVELNQGEWNNHSIMPGSSYSLNGGGMNTSVPINPNDVLSTYNHINDQMGSIDYRIASFPIGITSVDVSIDGKSHTLSLGNNYFGLLQGTHTVSCPPIIWSGTNSYAVSGYSNTLNIGAGESVINNITFNSTVVPFLNANLSVSNIPSSAMSDLVVISNKYGYFDKSQSVNNGSNSLKFPKNGDFTISFLPCHGYFATPIEASNGVLSSSSVEFTKIQALKVGYWTLWGRTPLSDAVNNGYSTIVISFANVDGTSAYLDMSQYGNYNLTDLENDISTARKNGLDNAIISFGGANNTFNPQATTQTQINELAQNMVNLCSSIGANGIDFDLEISSSTLGVNLDSLIKAIKTINPILIITAAPQFNNIGTPDQPNFQFVSTGSDRLYDQAIANGDFDYLFVQLYNTGGNFIDGYDETNANFISSSFNYIIRNKLVPDSTLIVAGEPSCAVAAGTASIYNNHSVYPTQQDAWNSVAKNAVELLSNDSFGGIMTWDINDDATNSYGFAKTVFSSY